jgi:hypothetical protein
MPERTRKAKEVVPAGEQEEERRLDFTEREVVLRADFGDLDDESCLQLSLRFIMAGPRHPRAGEWVYLIDDTGSGCMGYVEQIDGWSARVRPDWSSWKGTGPAPLP